MQSSWRHSIPHSLAASWKYARCNVRDGARLKARAEWFEALVTLSEKLALSQAYIKKCNTSYKQEDVFERIEEVKVDELLTSCSKLLRNETLLEICNQILMTWYFVEFPELQILTPKWQFRRLWRYYWLFFILWELWLWLCCYWGFRSSGLLRYAFSIGIYI